LVCILSILDGNTKPTQGRLFVQLRSDATGWVVHAIRVLATFEAVLVEIGDYGTVFC